MDRFDMAMHQWREGERRIAGADPALRIAMERVTDEVHAELRRKLGGAFTTSELVELYDQGTGWVLDLAARVAPDAPWAWEQRTVGDAAFARYVIRAVDYAGGRRIDVDV